MDIAQHINDGNLKIIARPNSRKTAVVSYDEERQALRVDVAARPEDNEANIEIVKFFSRLLKRKVRIKTGLRSKEKILQIG